tara:strand:- start:8 stop:631 length:624 start_codon:yes stop_codon:yes gene_type:complete
MTLFKDVEINPRTGRPKYYQKGNSPEKQKERNQRSNPKHSHINNPRRMYVDGKYISRKHPLYKPGKYKTFNDAAFDGTYKLDSIKEGYVYAITNPAWPEWVKIGMAIDADDRCNGYQTSSPFRDYTLEHTVVTNDRRVAEAQAHKEAAKIAKEQRGEWFKLSVKEATEILNTCSVIIEPEVKKEQQPKQEQVQPAIQDLFSHAKTGT